MMDQNEEKEGLLPPAVFHLWERRAKASARSTDNWRDYAMMMAAFQAALERAPRTDEACEHVDIEHLFVSEIELLANLVSAIFPLGGMLEFELYVTSDQSGERSASSRNAAEVEPANP